MRQFVQATVLFCGTVVGLLAGIFVYIFFTTPDIHQLQKSIPFPTAFMASYLQNAAGKNRHPRIRVHYIPLSKVPRTLQRCIILAEDASFWVHHGIDWHEIQESFFKNIQTGSVIRGGSTITQQVAKNLYLSGKKTLFRKMQEFWIARKLEQTLKKRRILEIYINIIEFGKGLYGLDPAARYYFAKPPARLSIAEMVMLAATIPSPRYHNPHRRTRRFYWRCRIIARRLLNFNEIDPATYQELMGMFSG